ncbi:MAG: bifunctional folylpolyglutamate synthase/dihydrofolate synthase, partial [Firmicutes bacterium]|nr:bifunctional folylpolyglutamate synthase/dihydrofolate synthase [Candidatus Colimorpha enterica]
MKIEEAVAYIKAVSSLGTIPGLERIEYLLEKLGHPEKKMRGIIHVAGTNGKGSFCSMLGSVLRKAGYSVGIYTSPHMLKYNERITVDGNDISDEDISRILDRIIDISKGMKQPPSEFEIITAIGYTYFAEKDPDFCIIECGMGGRWDATNVITPILSVITGVALDHTNFLGPTLEKIASE